MLNLSSSSKRLTAASLVLTTLVLGACNSGTTTSTGTSDTSTSPSTTSGSNVSGSVAIDGSSTVYPISQAVAEEFQKANPNAQVSVAFSGTGGGFKKFCAGEIDIADASRPIKSSEIDACQKAGVEFVELPVALDGLAVVANPKNTFAQCLTVEELKKVWEPAATGKITNWNQIRPEFPNQPLKLYGPGTDSGTFDYFTEAIVEKAKSSRTDYTPSEDDNVLVQGVEGDPGALGYFGVAYFEENKDKLKLVEVKNPDTGACKAPVPLDNVVDGTYSPLSRPLFIYVSKKAMDEKPAVKAYVSYYLENSNNLVKDVGYVPLPQDALTKAQARVSSAKTGSTFKDAKPGKPIGELF